MQEDIKAFLDKAESKIRTARLDFEGKQYDDAVSRAYYAVFNAMAAVLTIKGLAFSSHGQAIGAFNREFIKKCVFPEEFTGFIQALFEDRQASDYDPIPEINKEMAQTHIKNAETIVSAIKNFIETY
ncbi:MAG: HEPN domain-containing protein [Elusimicrobiota bacterium]